jgi:dipeptidase D
LSFLPAEDHNLKIEVTTGSGEKVLPAEWQQKFISFLTLFPHGAYSYNWEVEPPCANVSSNLAIVKVEDGQFYMETSCRFFEKNELLPVAHKIENLAKMLGVNLEIGCGYPSWKPAAHSLMVDLARDKFEQLYGVRPEVKAIHAGLECGLLKDKLGELDIISLGPNITGAHSPSERLEVESTDKIYTFIKEYLALL